MPLYNRETKLIGVDFGKIRVKWNEKNFIKPHTPTEKNKKSFLNNLIIII